MHQYHHVVDRLLDRILQPFSLLKECKSLVLEGSGIPFAPDPLKGRILSDGPKGRAGHYLQACISGLESSPRTRSSCSTCMKPQRQRIKPPAQTRVATVVGEENREEGQ